MNNIEVVRLFNSHAVGKAEFLLSCFADTFVSVADLFVSSSTLLSEV